MLYWLIRILADGNSAFPSGMNAAATWSTRLMNLRGKAMGVEHRGKGIDMQLGPVAGPLGRVPAGGRNWEGKFVCLQDFEYCRCIILPICRLQSRSSLDWRGYEGNY